MTGPLVRTIADFLQAEVAWYSFAGIMAAVLTRKAFLREGEKQRLAASQQIRKVSEDLERLQGERVATLKDMLQDLKERLATAEAMLREIQVSEAQLKHELELARRRIAQLEAGYRKRGIPLPPIPTSETEHK